MNPFLQKAKLALFGPSQTPGGRYSLTILGAAGLSAGPLGSVETYRTLDEVCARLREAGNADLAATWRKGPSDGGPAWRVDDFLLEAHVSGSGAGSAYRIAPSDLRSRLLGDFRRRRGPGWGDALRRLESAES